MNKCTFLPFFSGHCLTKLGACVSLCGVQDYSQPGPTPAGYYTHQMGTPRKWSPRASPSHTVRPDSVSGMHLTGPTLPFNICAYVCCISRVTLPSS